MNTDIYTAMTLDQLLEAVDLMFPGVKTDIRNAGTLRYKLRRGARQLARGETPRFNCTGKERKREAQKTVRPPLIRAFLGEEIVADNFAGGGGASSGIEIALGRSPDLAINHDPEAIAMHAANHPETKHYTESVWDVDPRKACAGRPVALAWFSPDCKHHSKAKGGKPREQKIRGLAWSAVRWAHLVKPRVIALENVEEFKDWGPLHRTHSKNCKGEICRAGCHFMTPVKAKRGATFRCFVAKLRRLGYEVAWKLLRACDFGAPTTRRRLFLIARCDGRAICWPQPTHGPGLAQPHRAAAEVIDWSIPCPSIFDREKPLADKTLARIARGVRKFVLESARPFIVPLNHGGVGRHDHRVHDIDQPMPTITGHGRGAHAVIAPVLTKFQQNGDGQDLREPMHTVMAGATRFGLVSPIIVKAKTHGGGGNEPKSGEEPLGTITASKRGEFAIAVPYLIHRSNGEREGQAPRIYDPQKPLGTICAQGEKHAACVAMLIKHHGGNNDLHGSSGQSLEKPIDTIASRDQKALTVAHIVRYNGERREGEVRGAELAEPLPTQDTSNRFGLIASHLIKFAGTSESHLDSCASSLEEPTPTVTASGWKLAQVAAFLVRYNGQSEEAQLDLPIGTLDCKDRYGLVTVVIDGEEYAIVDIGMRMLTPRELFRAQGFAEDYEIAPEWNGKPLSRTAQVRMCGNSVAPPVAAAVIKANMLEAA